MIHTSRPTPPGVPAPAIAEAVSPARVVSAHGQALLLAGAIVLLALI